MNRRRATRTRLVAVAALVAAAVLAWLVLRETGGGTLGTDERGASVEEVEIDSEAVGRELPVSVVVPDGADGDEPLLVFLHGRGGDERSSLVDGMFAALASQGAKAPIVAFPYGGDHSYWHDRAGGDWGTYVTDEVIPRVTKEFDADPDRVAIGGISMGGFGAYDLFRSDPGRYCGVGGHAPAIWATSGETAAGSFDDEADFAAHDVVSAAASGAFGDGPVWLDAGDDDPFAPGDAALSASLESAGTPLTERHWPGVHDSDYWNGHWGAYMRFYARTLAAC
jgi:S-formylglutathione hydrolase FrmB